MKLLTVIVLILSLTSTNLISTVAEEPFNTDQEGTVEDGYGSVSSRTIAQYPSIIANSGEFKTDFYIAASRANSADYKLNIKNTGTNTFDWKITRPNGKVFEQGTVNPGKSVTREIKNTCPNMPTGTYNFSLITSGGGIGKLSLFLEI